MNYRKIILGAVLTFALILLSVVVLLFIFNVQRFVYNSKPDVASQESPAIKEMSIRLAKIGLPQPKGVFTSDVAYQNAIYTMLFATPIEFYGKVVDDDNNPIADADVSGTPCQTTVYQGATNNPVIKTKSDSNGLFSFSTHGMNILINIVKPGYYHSESKDQFSYVHLGDYSPHSDPKNPAIFVMRKIGITEFLIPFTFRIYMPIDGTITRNQEYIPTDGRVHHAEVQGVNLNSGRGIFMLQGWVQYGGWPPIVNSPFDWKAILSIPDGGGFIPRTGGKYDFQAPKSGYTNSIEVDMPVSLGQSWKRGYGNDYYIKTPNNHFARVHVVFSGDRPPMVYMTGYLNPTPGHRNLEYDPDQVAK